MSAGEIVGWVFVGTVALLILAGTGAAFASKGSQATTPPTPTPLTTTSEWKRRLQGRWGVFAAIMAVALLVFIWHKFSPGALFAALIFLIGVLLLWKGAGAGKVVGGVLVLLAIFFGEHLYDAWVKTKTTTADVVLHDKPLFEEKVTVQQEKTRAAGAVLTVPVNPLTKEWSPWLNVRTNQGCVWVNDVSADQVRVKVEEKGPIYSWPEYQAAKRAGLGNNFRLMQLRSNGTQTQITYEFRGHNQCS